jgi:CubicO group peptidase (beta-lactamase class C family)
MTQDKTESPSVQAILAGNDIILAPDSPLKEIEAVKKAIKDHRLNQEDIHAGCKKILRYKYIAGLHRYRPIEPKGLSRRLNTPHAAWLVAKLNAEAVTALKNEDGFLPLKQLDQKKIAVLSLGDAPGSEFRTMLNNYKPMPSYRIGQQTKNADIQKIIKELEACDVIICGIYTTRMDEPQALKDLMERKEMIYAFFTSPYLCMEYKTQIDKAKAVVMAYEGTPSAQSYAAQVIFGGIAAKGKLSVTIPDLFQAGAGTTTQKTRLGYHQPEEVGMDAACLDSIDWIADEGLEQHAYPGCQVLVAKDGMIIYHKSFGYYDSQEKQRVTDASVYDLASVSKASGTLLAVMKACDDRLLTLDTPLSMYLPALQGTDKGGLTIEELLYHQSGMPSTIGFYLHAIDRNSYKGNLYSRRKTAVYPVRYEAQTYVRTDFKFLPEVVSSKPKDGFTTQVANDFYLHDSFSDMIMKDIHDVKLGTRGKYVYSCVNFILLKMIVENQMRQPMDQLLQTAFFDRLGGGTLTYNPLKKIEASQIVPTENDRFLRHQLLRGYVHDEAAAFQGGVSGNAGMFSNANDLAKVLQLYVNEGTYGGETYLSAATCRLFTESKSPTCRRGLGFDKPELDTLKVSPCGQFAPSSVYGHTGYTGTCFWVDPDNKLIYIFLSNRVNPTRVNNKLSSLRIRSRIHDMLYQSMKLRIEN